MKDKLTFNLIETNEAVFLQFSDGNVLIADNNGITAYCTNKTIQYQSSDVKVLSSHIETKDENITVWIMPQTTMGEDLGLYNDFRIRNEKTIRQYVIEPEHYIKFKNFLWKCILDKFN